MCKMCDLNLSATNLSKFKRISDIFPTVIANFPKELILVLRKCRRFEESIIFIEYHQKVLKYVSLHRVWPFVLWQLDTN